MTGYILILTLSYFNPITTQGSGGYGASRNEIRSGSVATAHVASEEACKRIGWTWVSKQKNDKGELRTFDCESVR